jgi:hypothetical protein
MMNRFSSLSLRIASLFVLTSLAATSLVLDGCVSDRQIGGEGGSGGGTGTTGGTTATSMMPSPSSTATTGTGSVCTPGSTMPCLCHIVVEGTATCNADGTGYGACEGAECTPCNKGRGDGCCSGDGACCPCVQGCDFTKDWQQDPATDAFLQCVCANPACASACAGTCAGESISGDCDSCAAMLAMSDCKAEYDACQP